MASIKFSVLFVAMSMSLCAATSDHMRKPGPLDPNQLIASELETLSAILDIVGHGLQGIVADLTGGRSASVPRCAQKFKAVGGPEKATCVEFLDAIHGCESLKPAKKLIPAAKKQMKKSPKSQKPCFKQD